MPVPAWLDDPEVIGPCPCGRPPKGEILLVQGDVPLSRWFHPECLPFLKCEMTPEAVEEMEEHRKRIMEGEDDIDE